ncbi:MAG TPA: hypothetical protein DIT07_13780 [Sphingobacteriaceae bacterium]|jgi:hypothetical protein|nr:hypothetical protein [Sphingobacteriaceae bacterium]
MDTKLTLRLEQNIIEKAKEYAKSNRTSLSKLIENYLLHITEENSTTEQITPLVKSLSGIIDLPSDFDYKKGYTDFLIDKYK